MNLVSVFLISLSTFVTSDGPFKVDVQMALFPNVLHIHLRNIQGIHLRVLCL